MLKKLLLTLALIVPGAVAHADSVQIGLLTCDIEPGIGWLIGSHKDVTCVFERNDRRPEYYVGSINKLGLDIGITGPARSVWVVFAAVGGRDTRGVLEGHYGGGSLNGSFVVGGGTNYLVGGLDESIALQPWSLQGQIGVNFTAAFSGLRLHYIQ